MDAGVSRKKCRKKDKWCAKYKIINKYLFFSKIICSFVSETGRKEKLSSAALYILLITGLDS